MKGAISAIGDKIHGSEKAGHEAGKEVHKEAAHEHKGSGMDKLKGGVQHAKEAVSDKFNKNRAEAAEKIHSGPNAEAAATKEAYKAGEQGHKDAAKDDMGGAYGHAKEAATHTKEGAGHKKEAAKIGADAKLHGDQAY